MKLTKFVDSKFCWWELKLLSVGHKTLKLMCYKRVKTKWQLWTRGTCGRGGAHRQFQPRAHLFGRTYSLEIWTTIYQTDPGWGGCRLHTGER